MSLSRNTILLLGILMCIFFSCKEDETTYTPTSTLKTYFTCDTADIVYNYPPDDDSTGRIPVILTATGPDYYAAGDSIILSLTVDTIITNINIGILEYGYNDKGQIVRRAAKGYYNLPIPAEMQNNLTYTIPIVIASGQKNNFMIFLIPETNGITGKIFALPMSTSKAVFAKMEIKLEWYVPVDLDLQLVEPISGERIYFKNPLTKYGGMMLRNENENCIISSDSSIFYERIEFDSLSIITYDPVKKYKVYVDAYSPCHIDTSTIVDYKIIVNFGGEKKIEVTGYFDAAFNTTGPSLVTEFSPAEFGSLTKKTAPGPDAYPSLLRVKK